MAQFPQKFSKKLLQTYSNKLLIPKEISGAILHESVSETLPARISLEIVGKTT